MTTYRATRAQLELTRLSRKLAETEDQSARHKCFLAHHAEDAEEVLAFVEEFEEVIIPRSIGVQNDNFIDSHDDGYVMTRIRQEYLGDTTVTIVLLGQCTWARKYIDWETYSSLRQSSMSTRNGLMSVRLPSGAGAKFPARLAENLKNESRDGYARAWKFPSTDTILHSRVQDAFDARSSRAHLIKPLTPRQKGNRNCP